MPPPRATLLDPATLSKVADFFLQRGGKKTGLLIVVAATAVLAMAIIEFLVHPSLENVKEILMGVFYESLAGAYLSLFFSSKRTTDMVAVGIGEIKHESKGLENTSADPAINRVLEKLENGVDPTGTSTGPTLPA